MKLSKLLRKDIEPRCTYCAHGSPLADGKRIACRKRGVMDAADRVPAKPAVLREKFTNADFSLGDTDDEK